MTESRSLACQIPLWGSRLIEASAGTGKTFTISALYLRLVLGHGDDLGFARALTPPEILVMTFTEAATFELKGRIRERLTEGARFFREEAGVNGDDFLEELRADYPEEQWPRCARVLEQAALWMDDAAISTIHSWCYRMLREHAFQSGSVFNPTLVTDQGSVIDDLFKDYWRQQAYPLSAALAQWMAAEFAGPAGLAGASKLNGGLEAEPDAALHEVLDQALARYQDQLRRYKAPFAQGLAEARALLEAAIEKKQVHGNKLRQGWLAGWLDKLEDWAQGESPSLDLAGGWKRLTPAGLREAWKVGEPPEHPVFTELETLEARLAQLASPRQTVLDHARAWVQSRLAASKQDRSEMGFDDMIHHLHQALTSSNGEGLAQTLRQQFPVALIDEFQDTDPIQYAILDRVYQVDASPSDCAVLMIGDPKQAIYGFRGADIHTYLRARQATAGRHYTLGMNYRSTQPLVDGVNTLFMMAESEQAAGAFLFKHGEDNPLPFLPVQARDRNDRLHLDAQALAAVQICFVDSEQAMPVQSYREALAEACAEQITDWLNRGQRQAANFVSSTQTRPIQAADMAILVREGKEADLVRQALAKRGIRSVYLSESASVLHSAEAQDVLRCLRACAEPGNERLLRAALATPTLGMSTRELDALFSDELAWETEVLRFRAFHLCWQRRGVLPMLRALFQAYAIAQKLAHQTDGERRLTNLLHLAELLQQASTELEGEQALIHAFSSQISQQRGQSDEAILRLESDAELVKVVTIHKSKGLEYPVVFLPFTARSRPVGPGDVVSRYDAHGVLHSRVVSNAVEAAEADRDRLAEDLRLLYVALTRARHVCWIGLADVRNGRSSQSGLPINAWGHLLNAQTGEDLKARLEALTSLRPDVFQPAVAPGPGQVFTPPADEYRSLPAVKHFERPDWPAWGITSYSALQFGARPTVDGQRDFGFFDDSPASSTEQNWVDESHDPLLAGAPPRMALRSAQEATLHGFPRGPQAGTFLHGILEWCARQGFEDVQADQAPLRDLIARRCRLRGWEAWIDGLTHWIMRIINTPLPLAERPPVRLAGLRRYQVELEFWFEIAEVNVQALDALVSARTFSGRARPQAVSQRIAGMLKGFMDLVFEHEGRYYVLDYKSNALGERNEDYTPAALEQAILDKRYDLQAALYALALHRHLKQRLPNYDPGLHFGGVAYYFFRGVDGPCHGLLLDTLTPALLETLDTLMLGADAA